MKFLIDGSSRKVLRKGEFVKADPDVAEEFVYETGTVEEHKEITVAVLQSVCRANSIHYAKNATRADLIANLNTNLPNLPNIPEQNTMTQSDIIKEVVTLAGENRDPEMDTDDFEVEIFTTCIERLAKDGIKFKIKQLGNLVKKEIAEQGLVMTNAQRKAAVADILEEASFNPQSWEDIEAIQETILTTVKDTDGKQALTLVRRWMKENELEMPKREKKAKVSFRQHVINFMIENSPVTDEALLEFVTEAERPEPEKVVARLGGLRETIDQAFAAGQESVSDAAAA